MSSAPDNVLPVGGFAVRSIYRTAEVDRRIAAAMEDYLRLRHKAKEAHAVSAEEQRQCAEARRKVT